MRGLVLVGMMFGAVLILEGATTTLTLTNFQAGAEIGTAANWSPNQIPDANSILRLGTTGTGYPKVQEVLVSGDYALYGFNIGVDNGYTGVVRMTSGSLADLWWLTESTGIIRSPSETAAGAIRRLGIFFSTAGRFQLQMRSGSATTGMGI